MVNSDNSDVDVCTVDDSSPSHTGLTVVAAETYIDDGSPDIIDELIPLSSKDLLTKSKLEQLSKEKIAKQREKSENTVQKFQKVSLVVGKPDKQVIHSVQDTSKIAATVTHESTTSVSKDITAFTKLGKRKVDFDSDNDFISNNIESDGDLTDTGVNNELKQFPLETDHLALKNNRDYQKLLKTLVVLEAQRVQAIKDYEELSRLKEIALSDPLDFVKKIQEKKAPEFPKRQQIAKLPEINWLHYLTAYTDDKSLPCITTRNSFKDTDIDLTDMNDIDPLDELGKDGDKSNKNSEKTATFNLKWSVEEQEKLEKLLVLFPPEEVEARRWEKIAKALGTRTSQQVSSRIQKYFLKLAKAKLPIPGRAPTAASINSTKKKLNPISYKRSTFFPSWQPSVYMKDDEADENIAGINPVFEDIQVSDEDDIPGELRDSPEYLELLELKKIRKYKMSMDSKNLLAPVVHRGFMCDGCSIDPIIGVRWHCQSCPSENSVDFCNNCYQKSFESDTHKSAHQLVPLCESTEANVEDGYTSFEQRRFKYNYLDPNFVPS